MATRQNWLMRNHKLFEKNTFILLLGILIVVAIGGITPETAGPAAQAGANILVAGSAAFKGGATQYEKNVAAIREAAQSATGRDGVRC